MSLQCPECRRTLRQSPSNRGRLIDNAMGTYTRLRNCSCGFKTVTVEIQADELSELRRLAYLQRLSEARA